MAKKKGKTKPVAKDTRAIVLSVKGTEAFRDWLTTVANKERITVVQLLEKALVEYAEKRGLEPAPKRTEGR